MKKNKSQTWTVDPNKNYKRISNGDVLTGHQVSFLLEMANPVMRAIILLDIVETKESVTVVGFPK